MPELPEVETMVRDLQHRLPGRTIVEAYVYWDRTVGRPDPDTFRSAIIGRTIAGIERRGKFALLRLQGGGTLAVHRGMTGSLLLRPHGHPGDRFVRAKFLLDDGAELRLDDSRKFGRMYLVTESDNSFIPPWMTLGLEPLSHDFMPADLRRAFAGRKVAIKTALLNQKLVAGIGNIYADEALFQARINPLQPAGTISVQKLRMLHGAIGHVLTAAIEARGTTFSTYRDVDGESGNHQSRLQVFGRQGLECFRCGAVIRKIVVGGRGTHFCPSCQRIRKGTKPQHEKAISAVADEFANRSHG